MLIVLLLIPYCLPEPLAVSSIMSVHVDEHGRKFEAVPEDVIRAYAELARSQRLGAGGSDMQARHTERQSVWAALCCDVYRVHLVRCLDRQEEQLLERTIPRHDAGLESACVAEMNLFEECSDNAARAYARLVSAEDGLTEIEAEDEEREGALWWAAQAKRLEWLRGPVVAAHAIDQRALCRLQRSGVRTEVRTRSSRAGCFFTTRWCPFHPQHSGTISTADQGRDTPVHWWGKSVMMKDERRETGEGDVTRQSCLAQAQGWWEWCGELKDSPLSMVFVADTSCCCERQPSCPSCSMASAEWSSYPSTGPEATASSTTYGKATGPDERQAEGDHGVWRRLTAWISATAGSEESHLVVPPQTHPHKSEIISALRSRNHSLALAGARAFNLEDAVEVVENVYQRQLSNWWSSRGAHSWRAKYHGELLQDWWVNTLLDGLRGGFFVDLAAFDAVAYSNTYTLEESLGWEGLCIEPMANHWEGLLRRRRCKVVAAVVGGVTGAGVEFARRSLGNDQGHAGVISLDTDNRPGGGQAGGAGQSGPSHLLLQTVSIAKVLSDFDAPETVHYLSLDIEGFESHVLESFPFHDHRVLIVTVERPDLCSRTILRLQGFSFLRDLDGQDEIWIHPALAGFDEKMSRFSRAEPSRKEEFAKSDAYERKCRVGPAQRSSPVPLECLRQTPKVTATHRTIPLHHMPLHHAVDFLPLSPCVTRLPKTGTRTLLLLSLC